MKNPTIRVFDKKTSPAWGNRVNIEILCSPGDGRRYAVVQKRVPPTHLAATCVELLRWIRQDKIKCSKKCYFFTCPAALNLDKGGKNGKY